MENNNSEKSAAEIYREERKEKIAKTAKKNARKSPELAKFKKRLGKAIAIILAIAIVLGATYGVLSFLGVPQKVLTAAKVGNESVSIAKYNFYYLSTFNNVYSQAYQYESNYGTGYGALYTGFDISKSPTEQKYTLSDLGLGEGVTAYWSDYFRVTALDYLHQYTAYYQEAVELGLRLTEDETKEIDESIESLRKTAKENDYSLNRYLTKQLGKGVNEKMLRQIYEEQYLAQDLYNTKYAEFEKSQTSDIIEKEYTTNVKDYAQFSVRVLSFAGNATLTDDMTDEQKTAAKTEALAKAKTEADAAAAKVKDEASFLSAAKAKNSSTKDYDASTATLAKDTNYSSVSSSYGAKTADWIMDAGRKVGDVALLEGYNQYVLCYIVSLPAKNMIYPVNVRHILFQFTTDDSGNVSMTDAEKATLKAKAQSVYDQFLATPTEETFATLAKSNSADTGSNTNGGLYESVQPGQMVTQFNDWCFDAKRKTGDSGIIETSYGYHIMYYIGKVENPVWYSTVQKALADKAYTDYDNSVLEKYALKSHDKIISWSAKQTEDVINMNYINASSNNTSTAS